MKLMHLLGLALVAVLIASAVAVSSASASLPELTKAGSSSELTKKVFKGTSEGSTILETESGTTVTCTGATTAGETSGTKKVTKVVATFTGCKESVFGGSCKNTSTAGEIKTVELEGDIGYFEGKEVGIELAPKGTNAELTTPFVTFECTFGFAKDEVKGAVIGKIGSSTENNTSTTVLKVVYEKGSTKGSQKITHITGGLMETAKLQSKLNSGSFEPSNQQGKGTSKYEEAAELKA